MQKNLHAQGRAAALRPDKKKALSLKWFPSYHATQLGFALESAVAQYRALLE